MLDKITMAVNTFANWFIVSEVVLIAILTPGAIKNRKKNKR